MYMNTKTILKTKPIFLLFQCDKGAQWSAVKNSIAEERDGANCYFSGCKENDHFIHITKETKNRKEANNWFFNPYDKNNRKRIFYKII